MVRPVDCYRVTIHLFIRGTTARDAECRAEEWLSDCDYDRDDIVGADLCFDTAEPAPDRD